MRWLELGRFDQDEVVKLAAARLGGAVPSSVSALLQAQAEGLPLFVEELLGGLIAAGALRRAGEQWQADERIGARLPSSFVVSVEERVAALGQPAPLLMAGAAVLGRSFDTALLSACTGLSVSEVSAALRACLEARLVEADHELGMERMQFRHALVRDAVLQRTPPPERRALAGAALAAVEAAHPGLPGGWCGLVVELAQFAGQADRAAALLVSRANGHVAAALWVRPSRRWSARSSSRTRALSRWLSLSCSSRWSRRGALSERESWASACLMHYAARLGTARVHLALAQAALIRVDWDEAERQLEAARDRAGSTVSERLELVAASMRVRRLPVYGGRASRAGGGSAGGRARR